jgi:hypothetical protein
MGKRKNTIFITIPAFNEPFITDTIEDAINKAGKPENLSFGVFNQKTPGKDFEDFSIYDNVRYVNAYCPFPLGANMARLNASLLHIDEEFLCPIDAHNFFVEDWDLIMIENYRILEKSGIEKPMLSQSIEGHPIECYLDKKRLHQRTMVSMNGYPLKFKVNSNRLFEIVQDNSREDERNNDSEIGKFIEHHCMYTGGEVLVSSDFIYEVSYDPRISFFFDMQSSSIRASTRGYRMFSSGKTVMSSLGKDIHNQFFSEDHSIDYDDNRDLLIHQLPSRMFLNGLKDHSYANIMNGEILGWYGAPDIESFNIYAKNYDEKLDKSKIVHTGDDDDSVWFNSIY